MAKSTDQAFESIRIVGGLLSSKVLQDARRYQLPGQSKEDYAIEPGLTFNEEIGRFWRIAQGRWQEFQQQIERQDISSHKVAQNEWLLPLLNRVLGYGIEPSQRKLIGEREFPITHTACNGAVPMVLCGADFDLDKGDALFGQEGRKRSPMGLAQEYLNAETDCLWAIVSNGRYLRLLRDNPAMTRPAYIEIDFTKLFDEDNYADFATAWLLLQASRLAPRNQQVDQCWLEQWRDKGQDEGERALDKLRYGVADALRELGTGFVANKSNKALRDRLSKGELTTEEYFQQVLRLVYRFLFLLTAEDRDVALLPQSYNGDDYSSARTLYEQGYSINTLRERARLNRHYDNHGDAWQQLLISFAGFAKGQPILAQPALGGLFAEDQCSVLESAELENRYLYRALFNLSYFEHNHTLSRINYRDMDTEEFGSVYESLLELIPQLNTEGRWQFSFMGDAEDESAASGHSRKLTGSYYTPDSLVQELIKSALEPVIADRLKENPQQPREAILSITVCDPACGSGHFLLAAARRLASELASIDAGSDQPTEQHYRHAIRDVVRHCIYGVDLNPMAVELCKTGLWLESIEPGMPLSFLDAHIQNGNALLSVINKENILEGISAKAFSPKGDDDKDICAALKEQNQHFIGRLNVSDRIFKTNFYDIESLPEESVAQVNKKYAAWGEYLKSDDFQTQSVLGSLYLGAYFSKKDQASNDSVPTNAHIDLVLSGTEVPSSVLKNIRDLSFKFRFFNWASSFPKIFVNGGFDLVVGNPPWDVVKEEEGGSLEKSDHDRVKNWFGQSFYELAKGKKDLYKLFLSLSLNLINPLGRIALLIPIGVFIEDKPIPLRKRIFELGSVELLSIYQNSGKRYFSSVHASYIFASFVMSMKKGAPLTYSTIGSYGKLQSRGYVSGKPSEILSKDLTVPLIHSEEQLNTYNHLVSKLFKYPQLKYRVTAEFHASSDKNLFSDSKDDWKVLKNDGIHQFNHLYGSPIAFLESSIVKEKVNSKGFDDALHSDVNCKRLVFRDIARADDSRTLIACILPYGYVSTYDIPMLLVNDEDDEALYFHLGYLNSLVFDFMVRPHVDKHVKGYILQRLPVPKYSNKNPQMVVVAEAARRISKKCDGGYGVDRAKIDASVFALAGLDEYQIDNVFSSFDVLKRSTQINFDNYESMVLDELKDIRKE